MNKEHYKQVEDSRSVVRIGREGLTLVELLVATMILSLMATSIYTAGLAVLRHAQSVTITTAAHTYAKEGLEEAIAAGYASLTGGDSVKQEIMMNPNTHHVPLTRTITLIWHAPDGSTSSVPLETGYVEVVARVSWQVPRTSHTGSTAISTLVF